MMAPNRNTLWANVLVDELAAAGVEYACLAPGSRSTPLTTAFAASEVEVVSLLDERSAAFFALGRGRQSGEPTAVVTTSGTATANLHPAVMEADEGRVPLVVLTADRPPELQDSGANQTADQTKLYGSAVRQYRTLPEPAPRPRALRSLRVTADRAVADAIGTPAGPVHLNIPFRKPLEPVHVEGDVPDDLGERAPLAVEGRDGPFVGISQGAVTLADEELDRVAGVIEGADRGLIVAGPASQPTPAREALVGLARATDFPVLADPLSGHRFGHADSVGICGGYDSYLDAKAEWGWPDPEVVVRFGASPTSKVLRHYLRDSEARQFVVDPAGEWTEAEFTASDLLVADPTRLADDLADRIATGGDDAWRERFERAEETYWSLLDRTTTDANFEGAVLSTVAAEIPAGATLVVGNSMPVRDLDRFGQPRARSVRVLGNRGVSGIDGVTSTALGAASATDGPLVGVLGDVSFYHDMNGLLALARAEVEATIVLLNNDGGGIFHMLPIEDFDPPFTDFFKTPHGLDFSPVGELYDAEFVRAGSLDAFESLYRESLAAPGTQIIEITFDAAESHRVRETIHEDVRTELR
ncbi:2-succinyl-5-enolpyruvyl-6-hydroxy-3-cyclohexene -1-carboxylate synthase [Halorhabdus sp. SVX81]|uniref:2-succinyl-5-enolpyruvyl-6-hydroxy-3- cyclohexene-1-carboxylic-acid synthase n=1 Tax=Halorhabdus sp. SVX81 TaxID=2978283 RepID=UPI0023DA1A0D|nr:2-succinyl-5-enolpyruvyl-6-hydroxy-3-cyclohexene-1-carboxylic-acid synthase [Halorhabdus sp. SVX81]WEL16981.1 2-succinyl-5-enolpyruvyl-6-hydroxy-3-cyclohexene -1-carboxylate synthase [Halorhabdus sp. SVX81]